MSFRCTMCSRSGRAKSSTISTRCTFSICQAEHQSIECFYFPVACNSTFPLPRPLNLALLVQSSNCSLVTLWTSHTFNHHPYPSCLDMQYIMHYAHAFASNEVVPGKPSIGSAVFATMLLPSPATDIIFRYPMAEDLISSLPMSSSLSRAHCYHRWNGTNCFGLLEPRSMDYCASQLKFKNWRQR